MGARETNPLALYTYVTYLYTIFAVSSTFANVVKIFQAR